MRIGVNVRLITGNRMEGVGRFIMETLSRIIESHKEHHFVLFFDRKIDNSFSRYEHVTCVVLKPMAIHPILWYVWFEWRIPQALKKYKIDVFLSPDGFSSLRTQVPVCMVVHDLAFLHYPHFFKKRTAFYYKLYVKKFIRSAKTIAAVSEFTKKDIIENTGVASSKVEVIGSAAGDGFRPVDENTQEKVKEKLTNGKNFFLFVGAIHPRKNVLNLIKAFSLFKKKTKSDVKLVLAGRMAWKSSNIQEAVKYFKYTGDLIHLDFIPEKELTEVMGSALAVVYPSFFEGFGLPILEAMHCDVPVITSNVSSMPEVGGEAALYVDPANIEDIATKLNIINADAELRKQLVERGIIQRNKFSWDKIANKLWDCIVRSYRTG